LGPLVVLVVMRGLMGEEPLVEVVVVIKGPAVVHAQVVADERTKH
jgi:hypothetical protein